MAHKVKKVAITGGTGPIGMALIKILLKESIEILLFLRKGSERKKNLPQSKFLKIEYYGLEQLGDYFPVEHDYDVFFHLGWKNTDAYMRDLLEVQYENVKYSCDAVELAHKLGCHSFIGAGSQAEYGRKQEALRDDTLCIPENAYGAAKLSACHATRILCQKYGIRYMWPRILSGYGLFDNERSVLISNILNALEGRKLVFSEGKQIWDFVYMDDIGEALLCIAKEGKNNAVYPVGSGKARPLKEYVEILCRKLGKLDEMGLGAIPYDVNQVMHLEADISKIQEDTGWEPKVEFEDGIEKVIKFYKQRKEENKSENL